MTDHIEGGPPPAPIYGLDEPIYRFVEPGDGGCELVIPSAPTGRNVSLLETAAEWYGPERPERPDD
jgi:hypothetical protein